MGTKSLVIKTQQVVVRGIVSRKILSTKNGISHTGLPFEYIQGHPWFEIMATTSVSATQETYNDIRIEDGQHYLEINKIYPEDKFQEMLKIIKKAGQRLTDINKEIKKKQKTWNKEESFVI